MKNMQVWNINQVRRIAGLAPLTEAVEDDDDLTPAERELADKAESDLKKGGVKVPKVNPDKDLHKLAKSSKKSEESKEAAADREEKESSAASKSAAEKESSERKEVEKEATPAHTAQKQERREAAAAEEAKRAGGEAKSAEQKRRGKAPSETSKAGQLRAWVAKNGADRKAAWAHAQTVGFTPAGFSTEWQKQKSGRKTATEAFIITHPNAPSFMLAENREMGTHQWVDMNSVIEPLVFFTEKEAMELKQHLADWKSQLVNVVRVNLVENEDEADDEPTDKEAFSKGREWLKSNPEASRDEFASHMATAHKWAKVTAHSSYDAMKKA